jgi:Vault protein inter-alpha-trypsin domain
VYEFPIDDQSAVYHFEAKIEDRVIIAECQEKKQVRREIIAVLYVAVIQTKFLIFVLGIASLLPP